MSILTALMILQATPELAADVIEMDAFSWIFMLVSMGAVTLLTVWSYARILGNKRHFDPDGTGPDHAPVEGRVES